MNDRHVDEYVQLVEDGLNNDGVERPRRAPEYEWVGPANALGLLQRCECGALVTAADQSKHDRFHEVLNRHAAMLAVLKVAHISYELPENPKRLQMKAS